MLRTTLSTALIALVDAQFNPFDLTETTGEYEEFDAGVRGAVPPPAPKVITLKSLQ